MKTIKFPKLNPIDHYPLEFYKGSLHTQNGISQVTLCKQVIQNVEIPDRTTINVYDAVIQHQFSVRPKICVNGKKLERMLRSIVLENLRSNK